MKHTAQQHHTGLHVKEMAPGDGHFINVEMAVDPKVEALVDIPIGKFVAFKYLIDPKATGHPINPIVSNLIG